MADTLRKTFGVPLQKGIKKQDDGTVIVKGIFTSDEKDEVGDVITRGATERAIPQYRQWGNIRYMHMPRPVGKVIRIGEKDGLKWNEVEFRVVPEDVVKEVEEELLTALSVGIVIKWEDIEFLEDGGWIINDYSLVEISLVDHPANYDAKLDLAGVPDEFRTMAREDGLFAAIKTYGKPSPPIVESEEDKSLQEDKEMTEVLETSPEEEVLEEEKELEAEEEKDITAEDIVSTEVEEVESDEIEEEEKEISDEEEAESIEDEEEAEVEEAPEAVTLEDVRSLMTDVLEEFAAKLLPEVEAEVPVAEEQPETAEEEAAEEVDEIKELRDRLTELTSEVKALREEVSTLKQKPANRKAAVRKSVEEEGEEEAPESAEEEEEEPKSLREGVARYLETR